MKAVSVAATGSDHTIPLDRQPLYEQLAARLRGAIRSGGFPSGRAPSFREAMRSYGVSLVTVRKAFEMLEAEGLVERVRGSGTYVRGAGRNAARARRRRTRILCYVSGTRSEGTPGNFFARVMLAAAEAARQAGYSQILSVPGPGEIPVALERGQADGVLLAGTYTGGMAAGYFPKDVERVNAEYVTHLASLGVPVVTVSNHFEHPAVHRVLPDYAAGFRAVAELLLARGHGRIALVGGPLHWPPFAARRDAFLAAAASLGLGADAVRIVGFAHHAYQDRQAAIGAVRDALAEKPRPTAVVAHSGGVDTVVKAAGELGLSVPEDLSLIVLSDHARGPAGEAEGIPSVPEWVTALEMPTPELGETAATRLIELIEHRAPEGAGRTTLLPISLREGNSVAAAGE